MKCQAYFQDATFERNFLIQRKS